MLQCLLQRLHSSTQSCSACSSTTKYCTVGANSKQKVQRDQKMQLPLLKNGEQKQGTVHVFGTQYHLRDGQNTQVTPLAQPLDTALPSHRIRNRLTSPSEQARGPAVCSCPPPGPTTPAEAGVPVKPCLKDKDESASSLSSETWDALDNCRILKI